MAWSRTVGWAYSCSAASGTGLGPVECCTSLPCRGWHRQGARPWVGGVVGSVPSRGQWGTMVIKLTPPNAVTRIQLLSNINLVLFYMPWQPSHWQLRGITCGVTTTSVECFSHLKLVNCFTTEMLGIFNILEEGVLLLVLKSNYVTKLTHWGRVTHMCVNKLTIIDSDNGLSPGRRQAIIWTNDDSWSISS